MLDFKRESKVKTVTRGTERNDMADKPEMHQSALTCLQMCGEMYRRRYVCKERGRLSTNLVGGLAVHDGRAVNLVQKVKSKIDVDLEAVTEATRDAVVKQFKEHDINPGEEFEGMNAPALCQQLIDRAVMLVRADYTAFQMNMMPIAAELPISVQLPNFPFDLGMRLDAVEPNEIVSDCKTSKRTPPKDVAETSEQMDLYSIGHEAKYQKPCRGMRLDYCVTLKNSVKTISFGTTPSRGRQQAILNRLATAFDATEKGVFVPCSRNFWLCGPKYCEFYDTCKYVGRSDRPES